MLFSDERRGKGYVCAHGHHTFSKSIGQPGMVINLARGQLNRGNLFLPAPVRAWEFDLARKVRPSSPSSTRSFSAPSSKLVLTLLSQTGV